MSRSLRSSREIGYVLLDPSGFYRWDLKGHKWALVQGTVDPKEVKIWGCYASALVEAKRLKEVVKIDVQPWRLHLPG